MHIRRDNLFAKPPPVAHDVGKVLHTRTPYTQASTDYPMDPFNQMESVRRGFVDEKRAEKLSTAGG